jgi:DNA-binding NarL/FixJ family response regulator
MALGNDLAMTYRLLIADSLRFARRGLRAALHAVQGCTVCAETLDVEDTVRITNECDPDLVLIDLALRGGGGHLAASEIRRFRPHQRLLIMGDDRYDVASVRDCLRFGCDGYVHKDDGDSEWLHAVLQVLKGQLYVAPRYLRELIVTEPSTAERGRAQERGSLLQRLSDRELMVFRLIGSGYTNRAAAERIDISHKTVEKHRASVMQKLKLHSAVDLRMLALSLGVLTQEPETPRARADRAIVDPADRAVRPEP